MHPATAEGKCHARDPPPRAPLVTPPEAAFGAQCDLYGIVRDNVNTLLQASEDGFGMPLPRFVRDELFGFLGCAIPARGFAHMACAECGAAHLVAFRCKGRGFCPSCTGRRMAQAAANLTHFVLPEVPLRQFVLTVPFALRAAIAFDRKLLPAIHRIFYKTICGFYHRRLAALGLRRGRTGSVTAIQRASSDLKLNPHLHGVFLDGVFVEAQHAEQDGEPGGALAWHSLPKLADHEVADILQTIVVRVRQLLRKLGILDDDADTGGATMMLPGLGDEPALDALASAAVAGRPIAGPQQHQGRLPLALRPQGEPRITARLCAVQDGFSLHANTHVAARDLQGRERLIKYILRPPIAARAVRRLGHGRVRIHLKRPFADGTFAVDMDELAMVARLAAMVPPPWQNQVRYAGVLAPASRWRKRIVPAQTQQQGTDAATAPARDGAHKPTPCPPGATRPTPMPPAPPSPAPAIPQGTGCRYWPWAFLKKHTFGDEATNCSRCRGHLRLRALLRDQQSIASFLGKLGLPTTVPVPAPARGPPYFAGGVQRIGTLDSLTQRHLPW